MLEIRVTSSKLTKCDGLSGGAGIQKVDIRKAQADVEVAKAGLRQQSNEGLRVDLRAGKQVDGLSPALEGEQLSQRSRDDVARRAMVQRVAQDNLRGKRNGDKK